MQFHWCLHAVRQVQLLHSEPKLLVERLPSEENVMWINVGVLDALAEVGSDNFGRNWLTNARNLPKSQAKSFITNPLFGSGSVLVNLETQFAATSQARAVPRPHKL